MHNYVHMYVFDTWRTYCCWLRNDQNQVLPVAECHLPYRTSACWDRTVPCNKHKRSIQNQSYNKLQNSSAVVIKLRACNTCSNQNNRDNSISSDRGKVTKFVEEVCGCWSSSISEKVTPVKFCSNKLVRYTTTTGTPLWVFIKPLKW